MKTTNRMKWKRDHGTYTAYVENDKGDKIYCHHLFVNSAFLFCINFYAVSTYHCVAFVVDDRFNKITIKIVSFLIGFNNTAGTFVSLVRAFANRHGDDQTIRFGAHRQRMGQEPKRIR